MSKDVKLALVVSDTAKAQEGAEPLRRAHDWVRPANADVLVVVGGDGFLLHTLHNMLDKDWGDTWGGTFSDNGRDLAALAGVNEDGTYVYDLGSPDRPTWDPLFKYDSNSTFPSRVVSRWSVLLTLRYEF